MEQLNRKTLPYVAVEENSFVFSGKGIVEFTAKLCTKTLAYQPFFIIDIYNERDHSHPSGHAGWWEFLSDGAEEVFVRIENSDGRLTVLFNGNRAKSEWVNPDFEALDKNLTIHLVLRAWRSTEILFDDPILLLPSHEVLEERLARNQFSCPVPEDIPPRWFCLPADLKVHIVFGGLCSAGAFHFYSQIVALLENARIPYAGYAQMYSADQRLKLKPAAYLQHMAGSPDLVFFVHADEAKLLPMIAGLFCKKLLYHMHLPDYRRFQAFDAELARRLNEAQGHESELLCFDGLCFESEHTCETVTRRLRKFLESSLDKVWKEQGDALLSRCSLSEQSQVFYANPSFDSQPNINLETEKRFCSVEDGNHSFLPKNARFTVATPKLPPSLGIFPPCLWPRSWNDVQEEPCGVPDPFILSVGSFRPDKHHEYTMEIFAELAKLHPSVGLVIAGWPSVNGYWDYLRFLHEYTYAHIAQRIVFLQSCSNGQLLFLYRRAALFITSSSYEGYSGSTAEALEFNLPVVARGTCSVRRMLGFSGLQYDENLQAQQIVPDILRLLENGIALNLCVAAQKNQASRMFPKNAAHAYVFLDAVNNSIHDKSRNAFW